MSSTDIYREVRENMERFLPPDTFEIVQENIPFGHEAADTSSEAHVDNISNSTTKSDPEAPLDKKIAQGIRIGRGVGLTALSELADGMSAMFGDLREDCSREFGASIAYSTELDTEDIRLVDKLLVEAAETENHGITTLEVDLDSGQQMWWGTDGERQMILQRYQGYIAFPSQSTEDKMPVLRRGVVWTLIGTDDTLNMLPDMIDRQVSAQKKYAQIFPTNGSEQ